MCGRSSHSHLYGHCQSFLGCYELPVVSLWDKGIESVGETEIALLLLTTKSYQNTCLRKWPRLHRHQRGRSLSSSVVFNVSTLAHINVGRTAVFDSATSGIFYFFITSMNITNKCIVTEELLNIERGLSVFLLNDAHLSFNFTVVYYKLCFNGTDVLINPDELLWQALSSSLLACLPHYLPVSQCLAYSRFLPTVILDRYLQIIDKDSAKIPHSFAQKCVSVLSLQDCFFSIFLGEDCKKL